jgi:glycerol kinase
MLYDIRRGVWDDELLALFGDVPEAALPEVLPSIGEFGVLRDGALGAGHDGVPVSGIAGDQQAALYGQGCLDPGLGKNTYGTGSFVLMNAGETVPTAPDGLLATIAWGFGSPPAQRTIYALEAAIFITGAAVQWLRDGLGIIQAAAETADLAASLDSNDGVYFVPALTGLGSPHWDPYARGTIVGLTRGSTRAHIARATLEAIAFQTVDAVQAMEAASGRALEELRADGGATANRWLMQFQADVLGVPIAVAELAETTALGAALLAGVAVGAWTQDDVAGRDGERARYEPGMRQDERDTLISDWRRAVGRAGGWARGR